MKRLAKEYNRFLYEDAPEQMEEVVFSKYLGKWLLLYHTRQGETPGVYVLDDGHDMAEEFLRSIAFHTNTCPAFKTANVVQKIDMLKEDFLKYKGIISEYIEVTEDVINGICNIVLESYYK